MNRVLDALRTIFASIAGAIAAAFSAVANLVTMPFRALARLFRPDWVRRGAMTVRTKHMNVPPRVDDAESALLRYLMYGVLPAWFIPGLLDWYQHRRTDIEHTAGARESAIHGLMMIEVGLPITLVLLCEVNPLVLAIILATIAAHEATALWDVSTAEHSGRAVTPWEQHLHSFLESLPIMAACSLGCLRWRQVRVLLMGARGRDVWRLRWKRNRLPTRYLAGVGGAVACGIVLPYGEEILRCLRTKRERR